MPNSKYLHLFFIACIILLTVTAYLAKDRLFKHNSAQNIKLPENVNLLIVGDSHAKTGINPKYIDNSFNLAQDSEFFIFSYYKLKRLYAEKPDIKAVIIAYSYHSLSPIRNHKDAEMMKRYHLIVDKAFYRNYFSQEGMNKDYLIRYIADCYNIPFGLLNDIYEYQRMKDSKKIPFLGGFQEYNTSIIGNEKSLDAAINRHYFDNNKPRDLSQLSINYLRKISDLSKENNIALYLVNAPVTKQYYTAIPKKIVAFTDSLGYSLDDNTTKYINASQMSLPDSCFYDYDHLNKKGAKVFSEYLNELIKYKGKLRRT